MVERQQDFHMLFDGRNGLCRRLDNRMEIISKQGFIIIIIIIVSRRAGGRPLDRSIIQGQHTNLAGG